jgi:hypothetical protein
MLPSSRSYQSADRRLDVTVPAHRAPEASSQAPTSREGSGKWAKAYNQGAALGRQMAAARGNVSQEQEGQ